MRRSNRLLGNANAKEVSTHDGSQGMTYGLASGTVLEPQVDNITIKKIVQEVF